MSELSRSYDIIVVGAGPSGAMAALNAAKNGFSTYVIEKERLYGEGRYKACGGAIPWQIVDEMEYPEEKIARSFETIELHHIDGEQYTIKEKGAIVWRNIFDKYLIDIAIASGAKLKEGEQLIQITKDVHHNYVIKTNNSTYKAKYVIAADGVTSTTLKQLMWPSFDSSDVYITTTHEMKSSKNFINNQLGVDQIHCFFGRDFSPRGYSWLFPKEDVITVGWGNQIDFVKNSRKEFKTFLSLPRVKKILTNTSRIMNKSNLLPMGLRPKLCEDNVLAVGDAGGFVEPFFGEGIGYAMLSGDIAISAIRLGEDKNSQSKISAYYEELLDKEFLTAFKQSKELRDKIYHSDENLKEFLSLLEKYSTVEIIEKKLY
ncbi:MAG: geranylgeranyl reductase family protein [Promethearchaeota archaeon]